MIWNNSYRQPHGIISVSFDETGAVEPVTMTNVKDYCRIQGSDEDDLLNMLKVSCRRELEQYLGLSLVEKEVTIEHDSGYEWELPYGPVVSVDTVTRRIGTDDVGAAEYEVLDPDAYIVQGNLYYPGYGRYVTVFTAGYTTVPEDIKLQLLRLIAYRYEHRGDVEQMSISRIVGTANKNFS